MPRSIGRKLWLTTALASALMLACLAAAASATAGPHLDSGRTYKGTVKAGSADGSPAHLYLYTEPGPNDAKSARVALYCNGVLARTSPTFPITQRRTRQGSVHAFEDVFSSVFPLPALGTFDVVGRVIRESNPIPRARLTVRSVPGCADRTLQGVKKWRKLDAKKDNTRVREIKRRQVFQSEITPNCPASSDMGEQVHITARLSPDAGGSYITGAAQSPVAPPFTFSVLTDPSGVAGFHFNPPFSGVTYIETVSFSFAGDYRTPSTATCSWPVIAS